MGNWNPNYFEKKAGSLEEAILNAVNGVKTQINEASVTTDLDDDPKLFKKIEMMGVKVKKNGKPEDGYQEVTLSGPQAKIDAANKKLNLLPEDYDLDEKYTDAQRAAREKSRGSDGRISDRGKTAAQRGLKKTHKPGDSGNYSSAQQGSDADAGRDYGERERRRKDKVGDMAYNKSTGSSDSKLQNLRRKHGSGEGGTGKSGRDMQGKKLDDIKRKRDALKKERERAMQSNSFDPSDLNLEILVLENIISEMQLELYLNEKKMDAVGQEDGDIDNDGDKDSSDKYLAKRRKAIGKAMKSEATGKDIAKKMMGSKAMKSFASKVAKMKSVTKGDLENMLPDYVAGADISKLFEMDIDSFKPHKMYDPKTGVGHDARSMDDHLRMKKMGYTHTAPKKEAYELGTDEYTNHTKKITPGQFESQGEADWNEISSNIQKKQTSMREALAKVWGMDEGKSPFESFATGDQKMKEKKQKNGKTMTGKPMTKIDVEPDMKEKKN